MTNKPLTILHIANDVTGRGNGIVNAMVDIACFQSRQGHQVAIASKGGEHEELLRAERVSHFNLDQTRRPLSLIKAATRFRSIVKSYRPDIVHCHMMTGMALAWALRGRSAYRLVSHVQNIHQGSSLIMGLAERIIPVANAVADHLAARGLSRSRMRVVGNYTLGSARVPTLASTPAVLLQQPAVVTVAGMYQRKGIVELILAFEMLAERFPKAHLYLVGDGPDRIRFEQMASRCEARDRIHFEGFQPVPQAYMKAASVFVLASHRESFGIVLGEAREAGCAIIASNVDGIPEALDNGRAGWLIPPGEVHQLADALGDLLGSETLRARWRSAALTGLESFTASHMAASVTEVYRELLGARSPATIHLKKVHQEAANQ